jgi:hypothetical protein
VKRDVQCASLGVSNKMNTVLNRQDAKVAKRGDFQGFPSLASWRLISF